jgi:hypothetical protein
MQRPSHSHSRMAPSIVSRREGRRLFGDLPFVAPTTETRDKLFFPESDKFHNCVEVRSGAELWPADSQLGSIARSATSPLGLLPPRQRGSRWPWELRGSRGSAGCGLGPAGPGVSHSGWPDFVSAESLAAQDRSNFQRCPGLSCSGDHVTCAVPSHSCMVPSIVSRREGRRPFGDLPFAVPTTVNRNKPGDRRDLQAG